MDIIKERGNSNKILGRVLKGLLREVKYNLVTLSGGSKNNAIPREAEAIISVNENDENTVIEVINNWNDIIQNTQVQNQHELGYFYYFKYSRKKDSILSKGITFA